MEITAEEYNSSDPTHYVDGGKYFKKISYFNCRLRKRTCNPGVSFYHSQRSVCHPCRGTENTLFTHFAEFASFIFACSPLLKPYAGTEAQLIADSANLVRDHQYWLFNSGSDRYNIYYYNPATAKFEKIIKVPTAWAL
mgnify:CR=1 FL=1